MKTLQEIGEQNVIAALTSGLQAVGDDCAVLPNPDSAYDLVLTSDSLIENVHFTSDAAPEQIGHKAVCRVLSDFAAMGAEPQYLLVNVAAAPEQDVQVLKKIYGEFARLRDRFGTEVVGGDLAQGPVLEFHVFGAGRVPKGTAVLRSGAKPGDLVFVTGPLGCAQESGKHLAFTPRLKEGIWLRETGLVTSMMDISDGLATDLRHILKASGVGAEIDSARIPFSGTVENALFDGEDFELLVTASEADSERLASQYSRRFMSGPVSEQTSLLCIGNVTDRPEEFRLNHEILEAKAFEHFQKNKNRYEP